MIKRLIKPFKWKPLPIYVGIGFIGFQGYRINKNRFNQPINFDYSIDNDGSTTEPSKFEISLLKLLPLRIASRIWGSINSINLPEPVREPILKAYAKAFNCDLSEAEIDDLKYYKNLQHFFTRPLKSHVRPIDEHVLTSPADGTIINFGPVDDHEKVEQVKGATYSLSYFLGPINWLPDENDDKQKSYQSKLLTNGKDNRLYQCVIYLAPGDYHRFHSPVTWQVKLRRHFSGKLFSVRPTFANWMHGLFQLNERVIYFGEWTHGFFSLAAIGATNVGSVKIYFDHKLRTNQPFCKKYVYKDKIFSEEIFPSKGDPFGEFNLGSTIVLIFEAPKDFQFNLKLGQRIKFGQSLIMDGK